LYNMALAHTPTLPLHDALPIYGDDSRPDAPEDDLPPLVDARQHDEDALAGGDAECAEGVGEAARPLAKLRVREAPGLAVSRDPQEGQLGRVSRPPIERVERPVEAPGHLEREALAGRHVRRPVGPHGLRRYLIFVGWA